MKSSRRRVVVGLLLTAIVSVGASAAEVSARLPVPDATAQARALEEVKTLFQREYGDHSQTGQAALAGKLLKDAGEAAADPAGRFVMLEQSRDIAAELGDADTALAAAYRLDGDFELPPARSMLPALAALRKPVLSPLAEARITIAAFDAIAKAVKGDDLETAAKLAAIAETVASRSLDADLIAAAHERGADVRLAQDEQRSIAAARKTLQQHPDDPRTRFLVGRFLCFQVGDWSAGLDLLADCSDARLKKLAKLDLSALSDGKAMLQAAEGWSDLAKTSRGLAREHLQARAVEWYRKAIPSVAGLDKVRASEGLASATAVIKPWGSLAYVTEPGPKGIDLGLAGRNVGRQFLIGFQVKTAASGNPILLTKRHRTNEGCLTVYLQSNGAAGVAADADFYMVDLPGKRLVADGQWHTITVEKQGAVVKLFVDQAFEGEINTRLEFKSESPWTLGRHEVWNRGSLAAEFRHVWIEGWN